MKILGMTIVLFLVQVFLARNYWHTIYITKTPVHFTWVTAGLAMGAADSLMYYFLYGRRRK